MNSGAEPKYMLGFNLFYFWGAGNAQSLDLFGTFVVFLGELWCWVLFEAKNMLGFNLVYFGGF